jgi:hypothetical protein
LQVYAGRPRLPLLPTRVMPELVAHDVCFDKMYSYPFIFSTSEHLA